jgi:hypothetical protein
LSNKSITKILNLAVGHLLKFEAKQAVGYLNKGNLQWFFDSSLFNNTPLPPITPGAAVSKNCDYRRKPAEPDIFLFTGGVIKYQV